MIDMPVADRKRLAPLVGMHEQYLYQCLTNRSGKTLTAEKAAEIERASEGKYRCEQLLPNVSWRRVRDTAWPWHPRGRPLKELVPVAD